MPWARIVRQRRSSQSIRAARPASDVVMEVGADELSGEPSHGGRAIVGRESCGNLAIAYISLMDNSR